MKLMIVKGNHEYRNVVAKALYDELKGKEATVIGGPYILTDLVHYPSIKYVVISTTSLEHVDMEYHPLINTIISIGGYHVKK